MRTQENRTISVPATLVRGGTSKCWLFDVADIHGRGASLGAVLVAAFGSRDRSQIDGVGGATPTTSKAAIVAHSYEPGVDIDYTFGQVGVGVERVEWGSNCGNCATAVGLYAVHSGLVRPRGDHTRVRMRNTNSGSRIDAVVATPGSAFVPTGDAVVPGVALPGVAVGLEFIEPVGSGALLPTARAVECLGHGEAPVTLVDAGAPAALLDAPSVGLSGVESVTEFAQRLPGLLPLRREAAIRMGLSTPDQPIDHAVPKLGVVGPARDYTTTAGTRVDADEYDVSVRMASMHAPHPVIGLTSMVAVAAAATVPGSTVHRYTAATGRIRIGTAAGVVSAALDLDQAGRLAGITLNRSARVIARADIFVPAARGEPAVAR
ncbi:PrpF domain-containing protein [Kibdelosporangium phytohabitans]|uniref:PrpF, AcnD-accessory n=1 Tax=Kibdelosporangium phytohabitans TaxID=860235 RepID=A0A0N9I0T0_9PSEU|nr:PrpF domain-containing protein [Kibdelosporangium phytohabitans]ALG09432.1 PrpF, AcnD-accessory [Kibdelosporangium phytohabitans]MBE1469283.1 2-methylaconitate cis-trans-isomerase PrpF [Kibdelosporangium phytohabitans]